MESSQEQEIYFLIIAAISIMLLLAVTFVVFYFFSQRKMLLQKMRGQEQLIEHTLLAQEEERSRIAKDMHDEIGSKLNIISLHTQQLKNKTHDEKLLAESVSFITSNINTAIQTTRRIAHDLLPPTLEEFGLAEALDELCDAYNSSEILNITLEVDKEVFTISEKVVELNLFRILQELISNSYKHGKAKHIHIHCKNEGQQRRIHYKDDGKGFDTKQHSKGLGMQSIESRIRIIKGEWNYSSSVGNGMEVNIGV